MKEINKLTIKDIEEMPYTDFVSLIKEENRLPGGKMTIREILKNSFINSQSNVLEVGCTNGFTSLEIARVTGCKVFGIDINENSLKNARERISNEKVNFLNASAYNIPFNDENFDLIICGNATSFIDEKNKVIKEYFRVVKNWGFVALTPMYYVKEHSEKIVKQVSDIIGTKIDITTKEEWILSFKKIGFEIYYIKDYLFNYQSDKAIDKLVQETINKPHLSLLSNSIKEKIASRWKNTLSIFNNNLSYVGYSIILLRKRNEVEETELFTSIPV